MGTRVALGEGLKGTLGVSKELYKCGCDKYIGYVGSDSNSGLGGNRKNSEVGWGLAGGESRDEPTNSSGGQEARGWILRTIPSSTPLFSRDSKSTILVPTTLSESGALASPLCVVSRVLFWTPCHSATMSFQ